MQHCKAIILQLKRNFLKWREKKVKIEDGGRDWSYTAIDKECLSHQKLEEAKKHALGETSEGARPCQHLTLKLLASDL